MKRPVVPIVIAVVLAVLAGLAVFLYARSAETRALQDQAAVTVLVSTSEIPAGLTLGDAVGQGLVEPTQVSDKLAPPAAISTVDASNSALVAADPIPAGQVILSGDFVTQMEQAKPIVIPDGMMAISVVLGDPQKVGSFLRPGSMVAIFDTMSAVSLEDANATATLTTRPLIDSVEVLAVGAVTQEGAGTATPDAWSNALVTLAVDQTQAEKIIHGTQTGQLTMALLGDNTTLKPSVGVSNTDLFK